MVVLMKTQKNHYIKKQFFAKSAGKDSSLRQNEAPHRKIMSKL